MKNIIYKVFLDKCKYIIKEKKMGRYINNSLEVISYDPDQDNSDEVSDKKTNV